MQTIAVRIRGSHWRLSLWQGGRSEQLVCGGSEGRKKLLQVAGKRGRQQLAVHFDTSRPKDRQAAVDLTVCMAEKGWIVCLRGGRENFSVDSEPGGE